MRLHEEFEWHEDKARRNLMKHGVSFVDAASVLSDPDGSDWHLNWVDDRRRYNEDRWVTFATDPRNRDRLLVIVWTEEEDEEKTVTRIISARPATTQERREYEKEKFPR